MNDFSERLFSVGTLTGLRAFGVDRLGRLTSPQQGTVFAPGENVAECRRSSSNPFSSRLLQSLYASYSYSPFGSSSPRLSTDPATGAITVDYAPVPLADEVAPDPTKEPKHTVGALSCQCGFYAYTDGGNDYYRGYKEDRLAAIVEGYGICTTGSRGFRASKARVVALIEPHRKFADGGGVDGRWDRVLHNYPGVAVFASKADALALFPLSTPAIPTPETDEKFWTREATR